ncbi:hypothetical protein [Corallococcus sicarius]|uniref:Uncharacterized protein n=1 Tax=Corallococcus sicarius TaxID=2316726 RepID=A0A3A8NDR0_9BACT|nr:hypothetical protein [Corallococcus sicarius]RKH42388.1 hypothetical protein D7X12_15885 [Corallococcus sicarius]
MATAMGGDVVMKLLQEFREMQDEARVQYARTDRAIERVTQQTQVLAEHVEQLATELFALTVEVNGIKRVHGKMFEQVGRTLNQLAEAQASDRQRIDTLELHVDRAGKP